MTLARVESHGAFETARHRCRSGTFDVLVTNMRLGAYNGLHLAYLCWAHCSAARVIVYTDRREVEFASEVHRAGAFYEIAAHLPATIAACVTGRLPERDRREPAVPDRRGRARGGRRGWDRPVVGQNS